MNKRFILFATLFSFLLMIVVVCFAFTSVSDQSSGTNILQAPSTVMGYGRKAVATVKEHVNPILATFGLSLDGSPTTDEVTRHLNKASSAIDEAVKKIGN